MNMQRCLLAFCAALALTSCGTIDPDRVHRGNFYGNVHLVWIRGGENDALGDGVFAYLPRPNDELTFERGEQNERSENSTVIQPEAFYTDGGSVPRAFQMLNGFNAWAYGPAYVIHDWLFVARKCLNDEEERPDLVTDEMRKISEMTFNESAYVMAETIISLASKGDRPTAENAQLISSATAGPRTKILWHQKGQCEKSLVSKEILAELTQTVEKDEALRAERAKILSEPVPQSFGGPEAVVVVEDVPTEYPLSGGRTAVIMGSMPMGPR